ncbi:hypothetical protein H6P81_009926 [Aristolochia fimbriata]|uniref:Uncharacterized protein n=1 Tax=Aristolochia fimbriata TaxID=158543 RepID=A0AAV7ENE9_ARIFI|nr:hypothetical protein H6P81_009926 [Aristolochia fimbriata]
MNQDPIGLDSFFEVLGPLGVPRHSVVLCPHLLHLRQTLDGLQVDDTHPDYCPCEEMFFRAKVGLASIKISGPLASEELWCAGVPEYGLRRLLLRGHEGVMDRALLLVQDGVAGEVAKIDKAKAKEKDEDEESFYLHLVIIMSKEIGVWHIKEK